MINHKKKITLTIFSTMIKSVTSNSTEARIAKSTSCFSFHWSTTSCFSGIQIDSALCNSSFSGIGSNWFCHSRKDSQSNLFLCLFEEIKKSSPFFSPLSISLYLSRLIRENFDIKKKIFFLYLLSFYHFKKIIACEKTYFPSKRQKFMW